jgi:ATP-dependent exoDNAse (exonuclease V) beta subunit
VSAPSVEGKKILTKDTRDWLFTELVTSARTQHIAREIREIGDATSVEAASWQPVTGDEDGVEEAVRAWVSLRDRNVATREPFPTDGVLTVTWADFALFARDPEEFKRRLQSRSTELFPEDAAHEEPVVARDVPPDTSVPPGVDPAQFGTLVHEVLQRLAVDDNLDAAIDTSLPRYDFAKQRAAAVAAARTLAAHARSVGVAGPAPGARVEVPFIVRLDRLLVRGIIDRIDVTDDGATITDYKVGDRSDHAFQVQVYLWAARRAGVSEPMNGRVVYLRHSGVEVVELDERDSSFEETVRAMEAAVATAEV